MWNPRAVHRRLAPKTKPARNVQSRCRYRALRIRSRRIGCSCDADISRPAAGPSRAAYCDLTPTRCPPCAAAVLRRDDVVDRSSRSTLVVRWTPAIENAINQRGLDSMEYHLCVHLVFERVVRCRRSDDAPRLTLDLDDPSVACRMSCLEVRGASRSLPTPCLPSCGSIIAKHSTSQPCERCFVASHTRWGSNVPQRLSGMPSA